MKKYLSTGLAVAGLLAATPALGQAGAATPPAVPAEAQQPAVRLNPTGRTFEIQVPVKFDGAVLGNVALKITADEKLLVDAKLLKTYLGKIVKPEFLNAALAVPAQDATQVSGGTTVVGKKTPGTANSSMLHLASQKENAPEAGDFGQGPPDYLPLEVIKQRGIDIRYDPQNIELQVSPTIDQRPTAKMSFAPEPEYASESLQAPAYISAYLNMRATAAYVSQSSAGATGFDVTTVDMDGALRVGGVVIEGEASLYAGAPAGLTQAYYQDYVFYRHGTRLVYDIPEDAMRIRVGDITPDYTGFQTAPDLLGLSVQQTYAQLQPQKNIRPTGSHSFRIERPSEVDIVIDDVLFRHIRLAPGNYDISELPLRPGANKVKLVILDDTGQRQTLEFTAFTGGELLAPGISEWSLNAGIKSYDQGVVEQANSPGAMTPPNSTVVNKTSTSAFQQRQYYFNKPVVTGFYKTGITTALTVDTNFQADDQTAMAGAGFATQTVAGLFTGELAASQVYSGNPGYAVHLGYGYDRFNWFGPLKSVFRVFGEYRSQDFESVAVFQGAAAYNISAGASYSQQLPYDVTAGLSFSFNRLDKPSGANATGAGDSWEADLSLSKRLLTDLTGSLTVGYGRDQTADTSTCCAYNENGFRALVRLAWTPDAHTSVVGSYDSRSQTGEVTATRTSETQGVGSWTTTVDAQVAPNSQDAVSASGTYAANRADVSVSHSAGLAGIGYNGVSGVTSTEEQTTVSVATSLVFADGAWGIGRPVTNGFALVTPHASLDGSPVVVGPANAPVAQTDWMGAAVVPSLPAYKQTRLGYDAPGAPTGYDLGSASYDIHAPYRGGYALQAGSAYTVTAIGTLQTGRGEPIPLLAGTAREANKPDGRKVELFTNRAGRFGAQGLAPGRWIIEMPTEPEPARYVIDIPDGVKGLHNTGVLKPSAGQLTGEAKQ